MARRIMGILALKSRLNEGLFLKCRGRAMSRRKAANRPNGRGSLFIERRFPAPVGKLRLASGTNDQQAFRDILAMLEALAFAVPPRYDILQAIKNKMLAPMYALSLWKQGKLEELPAATVLPLLEPTWDKWLASRTDISESYRRTLTVTRNALLRHGTEPRVGDLPALLRSYRVECIEDRKPVQFNHAKAHVLAFIRDTLRRRSELYADVQDVPILQGESDIVRRPQKPEALAKILELLPPPHRRMAWELAVTGMRPMEYFSEVWEQEKNPTRIHIAGTKSKRRKRNASNRDVPVWAGDLIGPTRVRETFENMWGRRIGALLDVYDLRRSFNVWMEDAGITRSRRKLYMGHAAGDITGLYEQRELLQWIEDDTILLQTFAGSIVTPELGGRS